MNGLHAMRFQASHVKTQLMPLLCAGDIQEDNKEETGEEVEASKGLQVLTLIACTFQVGLAWMGEL
jgi:hypothetical protein